MRGKAINLTDRKFGKLIVIKRSYPNTKWGQLRWLCRCDCGKKIIVYGNNLREGHTKSCGCVRKLASRFASMRQRINDYKVRAKKQGLEYSLTEKQFFEITQKDCHYCGAKPDNIAQGRYNTSFIYNGIDRIDNTKGYVIDNIVPCCRKCNRAKGNLTLQEYKNWIKRSYNKMFGEKK